MSRPVRFHPAALRELIEAAEFYDSEVPGLGGAFIDQAERALRQLSAFPESSSVVFAPVRTKIVPAFPYSLMYSLTGEAVLILAVAHQRRRPMYWGDREESAGAHSR